MSSPQTETTDVVPVENTDLDEFANATIQVEKQIEEKFPPALVKVLKKIAYEVSVIGLSEREACLIASYPYDVFLSLKTNNAIVEQLIEMKDLEYKRGLLKNISSKARTSDDKLAQWLLEARYPKEFNRRKGNGSGGGNDDDDGNMVAMAVEFVRKNGDKNSLVQEESGRAFIIKSKGEKGRVINDINQILR